MQTPWHVRFLLEELSQRKEKNSRYSLRAFAAFLEIDPSALSRVLNGKQELTAQAAARMIQNLQLDEASQQRFILSLAEEKYFRTISVLKEVPELARMASALSESERRFRATFEFMSQAASIAELVRNENSEPVDIRVLQVNPQWEKLTRIPAEKVLGRPVSSCLPRLDPHWLELYRRVVTSRRAERAKQFHSPSGLWLEISAAPIDGDRFLVLSTQTERAS